MSRAIRIACCLALLIGSIEGCSCKPKDEVPTQITPPPKEPPVSGKGDFFPNQKK